MFKLTIVTIAKGPFQHWRDLSTSLNDQTCAEYNYVFVDGGTDQEAFESFCNILKIKPVKIVSQDESALDALNQIEDAHLGEYFFLLHSDDILAVDAIDTINRSLMGGNAPDILTFGVSTFRLNIGNIIDTHWDDNSHIYSYRDAMFGPCINVVYSSKVFRSIGYYSIHNYGVYADREFQLRLAEGEFRKRSLGKVLYYFREHARSSTASISQERVESALFSSLNICLDQLGHKTHGPIETYYSWLSFLLLRCAALNPFRTFDIFRGRILGRHKKTQHLKTIVQHAIGVLFNLTIVSPILKQRFGLLRALGRMLIGRYYMAKLPRKFDIRND